MFTSVIRACGALLAISGLANALPSARDDTETGPPANYTIVPIQWDIPIDPATPGSTTVHLTGTIEEVVAQMERDYPGWNETFHQHMRWSPPSDASAFGIGDKNYEIESKKCEEDWRDMCDRHHIGEGIRYLLNLPADPKPKNGPGPGNCGRVSCSWNDAIYWCNDNDQEKELKSWKDIGYAALQIYLDCRNAEFDRVGGQIFYTDKWNVVTKKDNC
ncbi:hypothetical protein B0T21DRAFT_399141 [Apiosordaria backusii]|uniref:Uncharacterized protein n=1 Tax=Apiosordaria backusii TaxID=314023 RepID=A0AA40ESL7_9PEZI|nr:hypothetical protein B0T21DRAFT_399141 [Apiosordaria backusii]